MAQFSVDLTSVTKCLTGREPILQNVREKWRKSFILISLDIVTKCQLIQTEIDGMIERLVVGGIMDVIETKEYVVCLNKS